MADNISTLRSVGTNYLSNTNKKIQSNIDYQTSRYTKYSGKSSNWNTVSSIGNSTSTLGSALTTIAVSNSWNALGWIAGITLAIGGIASGISSWFSGKNTKKANEALSRANTFSELQSELINYGASLQNRDTIIQKARTSLQSSISELKNTYGEEFTNTYLDLYYGKNGITDMSQSILKDQYTTFDNTGHGQVATWSDTDYSGYSSLTEDESNFFNTDLLGVSQSDISSEIASKLTRAIMNGGTQYSEQFKEYQYEIQEYLTNALENDRSTLESAKYSFENTNNEARANDIESEQNIGEAEAKRGTSGLRGGTTNNNEILAKLDKSLTKAKQEIATNYYLYQLQESLRNSQVTLASNIHKAKAQQQLLLIQTNTNMQNATSNIASQENTAGISANEALAEAREYAEAMQDTEQDIYNFVN